MIVACAVGTVVVAAGFVVVFHATRSPSEVWEPIVFTAHDIGVGAEKISAK